MRRLIERARARSFRTAGLLAAGVLVSVGAVWLWAHEGHQALPSKGASVDLDKGLVFLSPEARAALGVETTDASLDNLMERLTAPAVVETTWRGRAFASTRLAGKIVALHVQPGQEVAAGQPLADVQSLELESLQLELAMAENDSRLSAVNLETIETSARDGGASAQAVFDQRMHHQERVNTGELARRKLLALGVKPNGSAAPAVLPIASPIAGVVIHADVRLGQVVEPQQHLFEIVDLATVRVRADVVESDLDQMKRGLPFDLRLAALPGAVFRGSVRGPGLTLDPRTRLGEVWADLANATEPGRRILPGMYGPVEFHREFETKAIRVPALAVVTAGAENFVFLAEGPGQYVRKSVVVLRRRHDQAWLARGVLEPGDPVVTAGSHELAALFDQHALRLSPEAARSGGLHVEPARRHTIADIVTAEAAVDLPPDKRAVASARLPGILKSIHKERDETVHADEVIAEVASLEAQSLQLDLLRSHLNLQVLRQTRDRLQPLAVSGSPALSSRQAREAQSALDAEEQRRDSLRRRLLQAGLTDEQLRHVEDERQFIETIPVRAPIDGLLVRAQATLGQVVKAEDPLFEIHDLSGVWVQGHVLERDLGRVRVGQSARVSLAADPAFAAEGTLRRSANVFDPDDRTLSIWIELASPTKRPLPVGMLARLVLIVAEPPAALAVPRSALAREGKQTHLFVRTADGTFDRRLVGTGRADDRFVEITSGLREGEPVAVRGVAALQTAYAALK